MTSFKQKFTTSVNMLADMKAKLKGEDERKLTNLINVMESPLFKQLVAVEESIEELSLIAQSRELKVENFDINLNNGQLIYFSRNASHRKPVFSQRSGSAFKSKGSKKENKGNIESRSLNRDGKMNVVTFRDEIKTETLPLVVSQESAPQRKNETMESFNDLTNRDVVVMEMNETTKYNVTEYENLTKVDSDNRKTPNDKIKFSELDGREEIKIDNVIKVVLQAAERGDLGLSVAEVVDRMDHRVGYFVDSVKKEKISSGLEVNDQLISINNNPVNSATERCDVLAWIHEDCAHIDVIRNPEFKFYLDRNNCNVTPLSDNKNSVERNITATSLSTSTDVTSDSSSHNALTCNDNLSIVNSRITKTLLLPSDYLITIPTKETLPAATNTNDIKEVTNLLIADKNHSIGIRNLSLSSLLPSSVQSPFNKASSNLNAKPISITSSINIVDNAGNNNEQTTRETVPKIPTTKATIPLSTKHPGVIFAAKKSKKLPEPVKGHLRFSPTPNNKSVSATTTLKCSTTTSIASNNPIDLAALSDNKNLDTNSTPKSLSLTTESSSPPPSSSPSSSSSLPSSSSSPPSSHSSSSSLKIISSPNACHRANKPAIKPKPKNFQKIKQIIYSNITHKGANKNNKINNKISTKKGDTNNNNVDINDELSSSNHKIEGYNKLKDQILYENPNQLKEKNQNMVLNTDWTQLMLVHLVNDGNGLGFGIIGGKSTGVVVKVIQEGGVADLDNTLKTGDHILQICDVNVRGLASEQVAAVLRQSGTHVRLLMARPLEELPQSAEQLDEGIYGESVFSPIVQTRLLSQHIERLNATISAYPDFIGFPGDGVLIEGNDYETHYNENTSAFQQSYSPVHQNGEQTHANITAEGDNEGINCQLSVNSPITTGIHDSDGLCNRPKTPKRLSLATVFEMSPLDTSEQNNDKENDNNHINNNNDDKDNLDNNEKHFRNTNINISNITTNTKEDHSPIICNSNDINVSLEEITFKFDPPDVIENIETVIEKDVNGLGMTVVGYASDDEKLAGLFVRNIVEGSDVSRKATIRVNDQITMVNGKCLSGLSNQEAVEVLRNTEREVSVTIARHVSGKKHEILQHCLDIPINSIVEGSNERRRSSLMMIEMATQKNEEALRNDWKNILMSEEVHVDEEDEEDDEHSNDRRIQIVVAHVMKLKQGGGLGMVLEGLMDESGTFLPFHFIRNIYPRGPIAVNGKLKVGDEVLEVNGIQIHGMDKGNVVAVLKDLTQNVYIVVARQADRKSGLLQQKCQFNPSQQQIHNHQQQKQQQLQQQYLQHLQPQYLQQQQQAGYDDFNTHAFKPSTNIDNLYFRTELKEVQINKNKENLNNIDNNEFTLNNNCNNQNKYNNNNNNKAMNRIRSMSLEPVSMFSTWTQDVVSVELEKGDKGLGFSVLDHKNPSNNDQTIILIRSLVPGGATHLSKKIFPGDRLVFVNRISLYEASLHAAVAALKSAPKGKVVLGVLKPVPINESLSPGNIEGSNTKRWSHVNDFNFDIFANAISKDASSMVETPSPLSLSPSLSPSFSPTSPPYSQHISQLVTHLSPSVNLPKPPPRIRRLNLSPTSRMSLSASPSFMPSFSDNNDMPALQNSITKAKSSLIPVRTCNNFEPDYAVTPTKLPLSTFRPASLNKPDTSRPKTSPPTSKPSLYAFSSPGFEGQVNFPLINPLKIKSFDNSKKYQSEKNMMNLDQLLFKASIPTSYSDNIAKTALQQNQLQQNRNNLKQQLQKQQKKQLQQQQLQQHFHQNQQQFRKASFQAPQRQQCFPSLPSSSSSPSSSLFAGSLLIKDTEFPLKSISIQKENLPLGVSIDSFQLNINNNLKKKNTNPNNNINCGFIIKQISSGCAQKDGRLKVGDVIIAIGNHNLEGLTTIQAKSVMRTANLTDNKIEVTYIPSEALISQAKKLTEAKFATKFDGNLPKHFNHYFYE